MDEERAAIMEYDGGIPWRWAEPLADLATMPRPKIYDELHWQLIIDNACLMILNWRDAMERNDWGWADVKGALPWIRERDIVAVGAGDITVRDAGGLEEKIYRRPVPGEASRWECGRRLP